MAVVLTLANKYCLFSYSFQSSTSNACLYFSKHELLLFCALMSSSDVVAPLTLIDQQQHPNVFSVIFGESILNDCVSIILFQSLQYLGPKSTTSLDPSVLLMQLGYVSVISVVVGLVGGVLPALFLKASYSLPFCPVAETVVLITCGFLTYLVCELLHLSGILGLLVCSTLMSHYAFYNLSPVGQ